MPTPPKPFSVLTAEKKSHRTKAELKQRQQAEKALSTGVALKERPEVKSNPIAHKEFKRLNELLKTIGKNDAIYEGIINRYCLMISECYDLEEKRKRICDLAIKLEEMFDDMSSKNLLEESSFKYISNQINECYKTMINLDKQIQSKRKMLLDIEKENIMTIASALRSIPKKTDKNENPLLKALSSS